MIELTAVMRFGLLLVRPGMLITSDSSFLFHIGELEVAVRKNLPLVCVVGVDFQWGLEVGVYKRLHLARGLPDVPPDAGDVLFQAGLIDFHGQTI